MAERNVIDAQTGQHLGHVSEADVDKLPEGVRVATADEDARIAQEQQYGGIRGQATAATGKALDFLTFGQGTKLVGKAREALGGVSAEEGREYYKGSVRENPKAAMAGEVGAALAGTALLGTAGAERALAARFGGGGLARTAAGAIVGAGEGAAIETAAELSEAAFENRELTAEQLLAAIGTGALIGGGVGGAISGLSGLGKAGLGKIKRAISESDSAAVKTLRRAMQGPEEVARRTDEAVESLRKVEGTLRDVEGQLKGAPKLRNVRRYISEETGEAAIEQTRRQAREIADEVGRMRSAGRAEFDRLPGRGSSLKKAQELAESTARKLDGETDPARAFMLYDDLNRQMIRHMVPKKVNLAKLSKAQRRTYDRGWDLYHRIQGHLEDSRLWGEAADYQRAINARWSETFGKDAAAGRRHLQTEVEGPLKSLETAYDAKGVRELIERGDEDAIAAIDTYIDRAEKLAETARARADLSGAQKKALGELRDQVASYRTQKKEILETMAASRAVDDWSQGPGRTLGYAAAGAGALGIAGGGFDVPGGPATLALLGVAVDPRRALQVLRAVRKVSGGAATAVGRVSRRIPRNAARTMAIASTIATSDRRRMERQAERAALAPQADIGQQVRTRLSMLHDGAPNIADAVADKAQLAANYLAAHAPRTTRRVDVVGDIGMPPTDEELEVFDRRRKAVDRPLAVLDKVTDGLIMSEEVHALENVYPELLSEARKQLADSVTEAASAGKPLPYGVAYNVSTILGQPVDPIDAPDVLAMIRESYAAREQEQEQQRPRPKAQAPDLAEDLRDNAWMEEL